MGWRAGLMCLVLGGCELLTPLPHDTGPKYATVNPPTGEGSSGGGTTSHGGTSQGGGTSATATSAYSAHSGPVCPEWCSQARGYHCEFGDCVLNGNSGPIQITLNWTNNPRAREDLDLHVIDPSGCEMYYSHRECSSGSLDLDQNAACGNTDNAMGVGNDTENIIFAPGQEPPHGQYEVWVVNWEDSCDGETPNPFSYTVTIRYHGQTHMFSGSFQQGSGVAGSALSGLPDSPGKVHIHTFTY